MVNRLKTKPKFKRFNDLKPEDINFNFHIHTIQTDGLSTPEEFIKEAINLKLKAIAFTEHVNKKSEWFNSFKKRIDVCKKNNRIKIFFGIESKAIDFKGTLDATKKMIEDTDIVIGVVHRYPDGRGGLTSFNAIKNLNFKKAAQIEFKATSGLLGNKNIDILGHPFGVYSRFFNEFPEYYLKKIFIESIKRNIAIEINTKYLLEMKFLLRLFKEINPYVSLGSDAHHIKELNKGFDNLKKGIKK